MVSLVTQNLRALGASNMNLQTLPISVARRFTCLLQLDLSGDNFTRLPAALSQITTLQILDMRSNMQLQLEESDLETLAALPSLHTLTLLKSSDGVWSVNSVEVLIGIRMQFTGINLRLKI
jgi:Leucine-rich repeat (LRR) protein